MSITQKEYDFLIQQEKAFESNDALILGPAPLKWTRKILSVNEKEEFLFDFYRGSFELIKYTYNMRYRQAIILLRYDSNGRHTNPDGEQFNGPHIHLYREGFSDKFAFPVTTINAEITSTIDVALLKVLHYCNLINIPVIQPAIF